MEESFLKSVRQVYFLRRSGRKYCRDMITGLFLRQLERVVIFRHTFSSLTGVPNDHHNRAWESVHFMSHFFAINRVTNWPSWHSLRKCSSFVTLFRHLRGPNWPFGCLDSEVISPLYFHVLRILYRIFHLFVSHQLEVYCNSSVLLTV